MSDVQSAIQKLQCGLWSDAVDILERVCQILFKCVTT